MLKLITSDEYRDETFITSNDRLFYHGSALAFMEHEDSEIKLNINYGSQSSYPVKLRSLNDWMIGVPLQPDCLYAEYQFQVLIFDKKEFYELCEFCFLSKSIIKKIKAIQREEIILTWMYSIQQSQSYSTLKEKKKDFWNRIIATSDRDMCVDYLRDNLENMVKFDIQKRSNDLNTISLYWDEGEMVKEANIIFRNDKYYFLYLNHDYVVKIIE